MRNPWLWLALVCVVGGAPLAHLVAQQTGPRAPAANDLSYERSNVSYALSVAESQVGRETQVPRRVTSALERARTAVTALDEAVSRNSLSLARAHYRSATRAIAVVSRYFLERDDSEDKSSMPREHRLRMRLARLSLRLTELRTAAAELDLSLDFTAVEAQLVAIKASLESASPERVRSDLAALKASLDELSVEVEEAQDALEGGAMSAGGL